MISCRRSATLWKLTLFAFMASTMTHIANAEELTVRFRAFSIVTADVADATLPWVSVGKDGGMIERMIPLSQVDSLFLSRTESSVVLAKVRQNIALLGDADYATRERAESELKRIGGSFGEVLGRFADHPSLEVRHRVRRLLAQFKQQGTQPVELDRLRLTDGSTMSGEALDFRLRGTYRGTEILLNRQNVAELSRPSPSVAVGPCEPLEVEVFHDHTEFAQAGLREFRFESRSDGTPFTNRESVEAAFVDQGLLLNNVTSGANGYVGVSVFSFRYDGLPVGGRSVCLYNSGPSKKQFQGVLEITFCLPGNPAIPAGVHQVGLFIARVKHSRDIVLEAYNSRGEVLATVEATDQQCVFAGVKSNEPITRLRIFSNPWLEKLSRKIDVDYAIDTLQISDPVRLKGDTDDRKRELLVQLKNGDAVVADAIGLTNAQALRATVSDLNAEPVALSIDVSEVASVQFSRPSKNNNAWRAMLADGSVVNVVPEDGFVAPLLGRPLQRSEIVGVWPPGESPRYPLAGDWKQGGQLVVFPTCRIRSGPFEFNGRGISWTVQEKLQQEIMLGKEDPKLKINREDPTPSETSFEWSDRKTNQKPTFWNAQPLTGIPAPGQGAIELTDGQRIIFGENAGAALRRLGRESIAVSVGEQSDILLPLNTVRSIQFP